MKKPNQNDVRNAAREMFGNDIRSILLDNMETITCCYPKRVNVPQHENGITNDEIDLFLDMLCVHAGNIEDTSGFVADNIEMEFARRMAGFQCMGETEEAFLKDVLESNLLSGKHCWKSIYRMPISIVFPYWIGEYHGVYLCMNLSVFCIDPAHYFRNDGREVAIHYGINEYRKRHPKRQ